MVNERRASNIAKRAPSPRRRVAPSRPRLLVPRRRGFTLTEMLAVLVIVMLIGGISAGVFQIARRNFELTASASRLEGLLLLARNTAITTGIPVQVVVDPGSRRARAHAFETVGEWSFEEFGGDGVYAAPASAKGLACQGHIGTGIRLGSGESVDCGAGAQFDVTAGLLIEAWVYLQGRLGDAPRPTTSASGSSSRRRRSYKSSKGSGKPSGKSSRRSSSSSDANAILAKGKAYYFGVTADGALEGGIGIPGTDGAFYRVRTAAEAVLPGRWTRISLRFDGEAVELEADGIGRRWTLVGYEDVPPEKWPPPPEAMPIDPGPLTIGSPKGSFSGKVDEVRLRGMAEPRVFEIPEDQLLLGWKKIVWFDRRGHLDARFHDRPVRFVLLENSSDINPSRAKTAVFEDFSRTYEERQRLRRSVAAARDDRRKGDSKKAEEREVSEEEAERLLEEKYEGRRKVEIVIDRIGTVR